MDKKPLSSEHKKTLQELRDEHNQARKTIISLTEAKDKYAAGDQKNFTDILRSTKGLTDFYPKHIEKEDKHFFIPVMHYFNVEEQQKMLQDLLELSGIDKDTAIQRIPMMGCDIERIWEDHADIEFFPNRPDLYSTDGVARALKGFLGIETDIHGFASTFEV